MSATPSNKKLYARIRKEDTLIQEHFEAVKDSDWPYEIRRLLEKAIKIERKEQEMFEQMRRQAQQDS
ncbi:hypothetical protein C2I27_03935 [Priestia megaterium]|uniref:hypothetical protein n=1 Tax=Priestia megaterium TaxID=1404 RepID=UPI000D50AA8D|nr:hypothetical protein [Priestia megaterium]PVC75045.1 hypothetical protein C2I27_03935 [Priestia megaterium]